MECSLFYIFLAQCISASAFANATDNQLNVPVRKYVISVGSPLALNCTPWNDTLTSQNLIWKHNHKAWLFDRTTRLNDSRTVQLYIPMVTYANSGTYQCCVYSQLGDTVCTQPVFVNIGKKPDVSGMREQFRLLYYGYPPQFINITWSTVSNRGKHDNGKPWKYEVLYRNVFRGQVCSLRNVNKVASWCTRYSASTKGLFSCNFTRAFARNLHLLYNMHALCSSIAVTNDFGTQTFYPDTFRIFGENAICTKPRNITVKPSGRGQLTIRFEPPLHMPKGKDLLLYKITYCNMGSKTVTQFPKRSPVCQTMQNTNTTTKIPFLQDDIVYAVSVSCKLRYNTQLEDGLVAGPYHVTTHEAAPDGAPSIVSWYGDRKTCTADYRRVLIEWKPPLPASWNGRPRKFILQYWQTNDVNGTRVTKILHPNVSPLTSSSAVTTNITLGCFVGYEVQIKMCTVKCGGWSAGIVISGFKRQTLGEDTLTWKQILSISVGVGVVTVCACLVGVIYYLCRKRQSSSGSSTYLTTLNVSPFMSLEPADAPYFTDLEEYDDFDIYDPLLRTYDTGSAT